MIFLARHGCPPIVEWGPCGHCGKCCRPIRRGFCLTRSNFEDEPQRQMSMKRLSRDEAFFIAVNIAKLPSVPRQVLKDIPRPPNSASGDD
jgi:hypothetical protein